MEKRRWPLVRWLKFAKLLIPVLKKDKSETLPYSSFPQKATRQLTSHHQPLALEGANFQMFLQDQEYGSREQRSQAGKRKEGCSECSELSSLVPDGWRRWHLFSC